MSDETRRCQELTLVQGEMITIESICRDDWSDMSDPCPECGSTEFEHIRFEGGAYGRSGDAVILRTDYWDRQGSLYTACRGCDTVLYKHSAYDILKYTSDEE